MDGALIDSSSAAFALGINTSPCGPLWLTSKKSEKRAQDGGGTEGNFWLVPEPELPSFQDAIFLFGRCQTHLYLNQPKEAVEALDHITKRMGEQIDPLPKVDLLYYRGEVANITCDLEAAMQYVEEGAILARM